MPGLTDTKYVMCECGSRRFIVKDSFTIQKRDLFLANDEVTPRRVSEKQEAYFCTGCGKQIDLRSFAMSNSK